jgi:chitinase
MLDGTQVLSLPVCVAGGAGGPPADRYCQPGQYPCAPGKSYHGRGPIQLSWK